MISVFFCIILGASALGQVTPPLSVFFSAKAAAGKMLQTINRKPLIDGLSDAGEIPDQKSTGNIEIKDIVFAYPSRPNINICNSYSLSIKAGETVALVGRSGAGKVSSMNRYYC